MVLDTILDVIYPPRCGFCRSIINRSCRFNLCDACLEHIGFINNGCKICGRALMPGYNGVCSECRVKKQLFDRCVSIVEYKDYAKFALINYKFYKRRNISKTLVDLLLTKINEFNGVDLILYVPIHKNKLKLRGFNQNYILAKGLSKNLNIQLGENILIKTKDTKNQSSLNRVNRLINLKGAFEVADKYKITGKNILLIDDIFTTGATVSECAQCLRSAGAKSIYVLTVASSKGYQ